MKYQSGITRLLLVIGLILTLIGISASLALAQGEVETTPTAEVIIVDDAAVEEFVENAEEGLSGFEAIANALTNALIPYLTLTAPLASLAVQLFKRFFATLPGRYYAYINLAINLVFASIGVVAVYFGAEAQTAEFSASLAQFIPVFISLFVGGSITTAGVYQGAKALEVPFIGTGRVTTTTTPLTHNHK